MNEIKIIAEIGINHDGSLERARDLVYEASRAGVHAVKFQYRNLDNAYSEQGSREIGDEILKREIARNYLSPDQILVTSREAKKLGLAVGISFFDVEDVSDFGTSIKEFDFFKIPSAEMMNFRLIETLVTLKRHIYVSTGCHYEAELEDTFERLDGIDWTPMHCMSNYPTSLQNTRLGYLKFLRERWNRPVGYSSHDEYWEVCLLAMNMGAVVIERHITFDKDGDGLDHSSSSTPDEFLKLTTFAAQLDFISSGDDRRTPNQGELLNRQNLGRSFFAVKNLPVGHRVSRKDLVYRAPSVGLSVSEIEDYLGSSLVESIDEGMPLSRSAFQKVSELSEKVIEFSRERQLSLPVRLHDFEDIQRQFPLKAFEFHLSYTEVLSDILNTRFPRENRYSIHLPDYINSTRLLDPFSSDQDIRHESLNIVNRTVKFAQRLQEISGEAVPVVGSFSIVARSKEIFYEMLHDFLVKYEKCQVDIMPQWLPPIAWYFGGSVRLDIMNGVEDERFLKEHGIPICLDVCHLILGRNAFGFSVDSMINNLSPLVGHIHIADATGIDGEGLAIGDGDRENLSIFRDVLKFDCLKVIEVWQGHLDNGARFRDALVKLESLYGN